MLFQGGITIDRTMSSVDTDLNQLNAIRNWCLFGALQLVTGSIILTPSTHGGVKEWW